MQDKLIWSLERSSAANAYPLAVDLLKEKAE